jgi:hypothetical protein
MKTHILQLESHDDVISTRDKMGWDQAGRIILVWPERGRILTRKLDLVLLQRRCYDIGSQMALVTNDVQVCDYARELRIPVFDSTLQAQNSRWRSSRRRSTHRLRPDPKPDLEILRQEAHPASPAWQSKPITRLGFFALGVIAFLSIVAVLLPGAEISIVPKTQIQETSFSVSASTGFEAIRLSGEVPAYTTTIIVEGRQAISTTGITQVPEKAATGYVRFSNFTEQEVNVPKGTIITAIPEKGSPIGFITTSDGVVPAGSGKTISLPVRAMNPGIGGNLPSGSLTAIEGPIGLSLAVTNPVGTSGGTDRSVAAPNPLDYTKLAGRLTASLTKTALEEIRRSLDPQDIIITSTLALVKGENTFEPPAPTSTRDILPATNEINLAAQQEIQVMVVSVTSLRELAKDILDANMAENLRAQPGTLEIQSISIPVVTKDGSAQWQLHASRTVQFMINESRAINLVLGRSPVEARRFLFAQMPLKEPPQIKMVPDWWPIMPVMSFRVGVKIQ